MSKRILLGITGSIAAYKALDIARLLRQDGHDVQIVATRNALRFFPRLNAEIFTGHPVYVDLFDSSSSVRHVELASHSDLILIAPASADFLSKMALGLADDLLSAICLSTTSPIIVAPAMEENMYFHPAVQENMKTLLSRGIREIPPETGPLASGKDGTGRLASPDAVKSAILSVIEHTQNWKRVRVLISAGPTHEPIDPVRFIGNRSSGKMGYALAAACASRGAAVTLVSGPVNLLPPQGVSFRSITSARELAMEMGKAFPAHDICFMTAAVADYRVKAPMAGKKKKDGKVWTLELEENPDILSSLSRMKTSHQYLVGFAAETVLDPKKLLEKLRKKGADMLLANDVSQPGIGFSSDSNELTMCLPDGQVISMGRHLKTVLAEKILDAIEKSGSLSTFLSGTDPAENCAMPPQG
ncbi:MAG: bifunctional phosphopantothenoylcysteine decarboxylase/phosphopantothenate--cysteine ligase CoaBC [Leptospirillum sp.]